MLAVDGADGIHTNDDLLQSSLASRLRPPLSSRPGSVCLICARDSDCVQTNANKPNTPGFSSTGLNKASVNATLGLVYCYLVIRKCGLLSFVCDNLNKIFRLTCIVNHNVNFSHSL